MVKYNKHISMLIVRQFNNGVSKHKIVRILKIPRTTVRKICKRFLANDTVDFQQRSGRPNKLNDRYKRKPCLQQLERHPFFCAREVHASAGSMPNISIQTVRCILRKAGLHGRVVAKKPLLNRGHIKKRLLWCKTYLEMDVGSQRNFIFSDEARQELYSRRRQYVRRLVGQ